MQNDKPDYAIDGTTLVIIHPDPSLCGAKNDQPITPDDMLREIDKDDLRYDTLSQEFNEYILDDGSKIKIYANVTKISRTKLTDKLGEPVYLVEYSRTLDIKIAPQYK